MPLNPPHRRRNHLNASAPFKVGDKIRATGHFGRHSYEPGRTYTVTTVDCGDNTLKARDAQGEEGNWIKWADCQKFSDIGWHWLKTVLPAEALDLLSAFDGLENLSLREDIRNRLVLQIPSLHDKILAVQSTLETAPLSEVDEDASPNGMPPHFNSDLEDFEKELQDLGDFD